TVFEAELVGVLLALRIVDSIPSARDVAICLDNQSAITRAHRPKPKPGQLITSAIQDEVERLRTQRPELRLRLVWVPGHEGVDGNELADAHAKMASAGEDTGDARIDDELLPDSIAARRAASKKAARASWQSRW
ncbi:hypothetical protein EXIGLDRAFT_569614, partial [Exidia glandulosa HHB12029]